MRNHKVYFVQSEMWEEVLELRKQIFPYPENFPSVAKYLSRLGMYDTATTFVFNSSIDSIIYSNDNRAENGDLTTNGAGLISLSRAKEVSEKLELDETRSAFQIRYSGFKDVVSCTHDNGVQLGGKNLLMRKSMKKFENKDQKFCITSYSKCQRVYLNRKIINLLSSFEEYSIKDILIQYIDKELEDIVNMFEIEEIALQNLQIFLPLNNLSFMLDSKSSFTKNKNWLEILKGIYCLRSMELKNEMNIAFDDGPLLLEIPDPHGVLKVNEMFVQVHKNHAKTGFYVLEPLFAPW